MRLLILVCCVVVAAVAWFAETGPSRELADRESAFASPIAPHDLVFQDLDCGERCALIRRITGSRYTHVGIVLEEDGRRVVWEALGPVAPIALEEWVSRGIDGAIAVYRPKPSLVMPLDRLDVAVRSLAGRPYDGAFQWDDETIYCSELVAKAYRRMAGRDVFEPRTVELGLDAARATALSGGRFTRTTRVVSPADLVRSGVFVRVVDELSSQALAATSR